MMGFFKKLLALLLLLGLLFIGLRQFGVIETGNDAIAKIDKTFGVNNFSFAPEIGVYAVYEKQLRGVLVITEEEGKILEAKLEVLQMQKSLQLYIEHRQNVDFEEPACGPVSEVGKMKTQLAGAIKHGKAALQAAQKVQAEKLGNTTASNFKEFVQNQIAEFEAKMISLESIC